MGFSGVPRRDAPSSKPTDDNAQEIVVFFGTVDELRLLFDASETDLQRGRWHLQFALCNNRRRWRPRATASDHRKWLPQAAPGMPRVTAAPSQIPKVRGGAGVRQQRGRHRSVTAQGRSRQVARADDCLLDESRRARTDGRPCVRGTGRSKTRFDSPCNSLCAISTLAAPPGAPGPGSSSDPAQHSRGPMSPISPGPSRKLRRSDGSWVSSVSGRTASEFEARRVGFVDLKQQASWARSSFERHPHTISGRCSKFRQPLPKSRRKARERSCVSSPRPVRSCVAFIQC